MEKRYLDFTYSIDDDKMEIIPDEGYIKPESVFKFYSINRNSIDGLVNQYVYATHPSQFNDLFDCSEDLLIFDDLNVIHEFLKNILDKPEIEKLVLSEFDKVSTFVQRNFRELIYRKWGILSLTGNPNNIIMWSYYTNHRGFCIEYNISEFPFYFHGPFPVNYQNKLTPLSVSQVGIPLGVLMQSNLKYDGWKHEDEWRILIEAPKGQDMFSPNFEILRKLGGHDRKFKFPIQAIKSISLGNRFFEPDEITDLKDNALEINLKYNIEAKSFILSFLVENNISIHIALRTSLTEIGFKKISLQKIDVKKFIIK